MIDVEQLTALIEDAIAAGAAPVEDDAAIVLVANIFGPRMCDAESRSAAA